MRKNCSTAWELLSHDKENIKPNEKKRSTFFILFYFNF